MTLKQELTQVLGELSGVVLRDNPEYIMPTEDFEKARDQVLSVVRKRLPNPDETMYDLTIEQNIGVRYAIEQIEGVLDE